MKIYEITTRTPNEQLINSELVKLYEAAAAAPAAAAGGTGFFSAVGGVLMNALRAAGFYFLLKPILTYYTNMSAAETNLKSAHHSAEAQAKYNEEHNIQTGMLITSLASALLTKSIVGSLAGLLGFLKWIPGIGPIIAKIIGFMSQAAQVYLLNKIASTEGRTMLAEMLTFTLLNGDQINGVKGVGALGNKAVDYFAGLVQESISAAEGVTPAEKPADKTDEVPTEKPVAKPESNKPAPTSTPTTEPNISDVPADTSTAPADQKPNDQFTPARFKRNKQGELVLKYADSD